MKKARGMGGVFRPHYKKNGEKIFYPTWWIFFNHNGKQIKESSGSNREADAWRLLKRRHAEMAAGKPVGPDIERTTFEDLAAMLLNDYRANGRRSVGKCGYWTAHLRSYFGLDKAKNITADRVTAYVTMRQDEKASASTIDGELAALNRMFTLALRAGKVAQKPYIARLHVQNARKGFFEADQFQAVLGHLPEDIKPVAVCAYVTGWRIADEILTRQKHHLNLKAGWLRLEPGETKNNEGRNFPLTPMLREALEEQVKRTERLQRERGVIIPWLFHRKGKEIKNYRKSWLRACKAAGVPGKIPHDFRRTAVRNLERAGVSRSAAMALVGHKSQSIYNRYAIVALKDLEEAALKLEALHRADQGEKKVREVETN